MTKTTLTISIVAALFFFSAAARASTYYTATTGSDNNSCDQAQDPSMAKLTIQAGLSCLSSGDRLIIKGGTYVESINNGVRQIPSGGGSWESATAVQGEYGETVILQPAAGERNDPWAGQENVIAVYDASWIIFDNLTLDAANALFMAARFGSGAHHVRIVNSTLQNGQYNCVYIDDSSVANIEVINSRVHDCQLSSVADHGHGIYLHGSGHIVEGNEFYETAPNAQSYAVHMYDPSGQTDGNVVSSNYFHNVANGMLLGSGVSNGAYNNWVDGATGIGITVGFGATNYDADINGNTITNSGYCVWITSPSVATIVEDNVCSNNMMNEVADAGEGTVQSNNLSAP